MNLLEIRNKLKSKKPNFVRHDSHKLHTPKNWRKPRGKHNKQRLNKAGHRKSPSTGFGSPKKVKFLNREGYKIIHVKNIKYLEKIDKNKEAVLLLRTLGLKKKIEILEKCKLLGLKVLNLKDIDAFLTKIKEQKAGKKQAKTKKEEEKIKAKEEAKKKAEEKEKEKEKVEEEKTDEEKKTEKQRLEQELLKKEQVQQKQKFDKAQMISKTGTSRTKIISGEKQ